jgi:predicted dehydrogenase
MNTPTAQPTRTTPLRLIHVGLGGWGQGWAATVVPNLPSVKAVAWVDASKPTLEAVQQSLKLPKNRCFASLQQALEHIQADAVVVTTPVGVHAPVALEALAAGLHVLVEKPFAPTLEQAQTVVKAAQVAKRILMVSQNYRFHPAPQRVAKLVREQTLGQVGVVHVDFRRDNTQAAADSPHLRWKQPLLLDMAIHHLDLMRFILHQEPLELHCRAWNPAWSQYTDPASALIDIGFDGGTVVSYRGSWISPGPVTAWAGEWRLECEHGEIRFASRGDPGVPDVVRVHRHGQTARTLKLSIPEHLGRIGSLHAFVEAIRNETEPLTSGRNNLGSLQLALAAIRSSEQQRPLRLKPITGIGHTWPH